MAPRLGQGGKKIEKQYRPNKIILTKSPPHLERGACCILIGSSGGCCIWFHVICCAWLRVMFQIMECVASSISRWLGCKAEYYLLSCSTHSISCLQLSRITNRSLAWRKFLQDPNWCDAFNMYVCHWVRYCSFESVRWWFLLMRFATIALMFLSTECVASSISRWLGCKGVI